MKNEKYGIFNINYWTQVLHGYIHAFILYFMPKLVQVFIYFYHGSILQEAHGRGTLLSQIPVDMFSFMPSTAFMMDF